MVSFDFQLDLSFGSVYVWSMVFRQMERLKILQQMVDLIERMYFSIKPMMTITFQDQCYWIWNRVLFTQL